MFKTHDYDESWHISSKNIWNKWKYIKRSYMRSCITKCKINPAGWIVEQKSKHNSKNNKWF